MAKASMKWQVKTVLACAAAVAAEYKDLAHGDGSVVLNILLSQTAKLAADETQQGELRRFYLVLATLQHHQRRGGLTKLQVSDAIGLAQGLLRIHGVHPETSRLSFMHAQLHAVLSQLERKRGRHWAALAQQEQAVQCVGGKSAWPVGPLQLQLAQRLVRCGESQLAKALLEQALAGLALEEAGHAKLWQVRVLRWSGEGGSAEVIANQRLNDAPDTPDAALLRWELACLDLSQRSASAAMLTCLKRGGQKGKARPLLEASLWGRAVAAPDLTSRLSLVRTLTRSRHLQVRGSGKLYKAALVFEQCYDADIPATTKLLRLNQVLETAGELQTIEQELLIWAGSARYFIRAKRPILAAGALQRYQGLSRQVSAGKNPDVLGVTGDLNDVVPGRLA